jgi:hypothetical protein
MMESDPSFVRAGAQLLSVAKSFERVGDRLTNVAEQILYEINGKTEFAHRPKVGRADRKGLRSRAVSGAQTGRCKALSRPAVSSRTPARRRLNSLGCSIAAK